MSETYIFDAEDGIFVRCGCFFGSVDDFKNRVIKEKGEDNGYLKIVDLYVNEIKKRLNGTTSKHYNAFCMLGGN